jgi:signal transduction histidine kinase
MSFVLLTGTVIADFGWTARACRVCCNGDATIVPVSSRPPTRQRVDHPPLAAGPGDDARFAAWLQRTREAERAALARELHDELGAILTAARLDAAWISAQPASHEPAIAQRLAALQQVLTQGIELKRRIIDDLHPTILTHLGLLAALEQLLASHRMRFAGRVSASLDPTVRLAGEPALALYRIVQESLTNIHKYAHADLVRVTLRRVQGRIELAIDDDGTGFDADAVAQDRHGLAGMRHRMLAVGGQLAVTSAKGAGTSIRASLPAPARERAQSSSSRRPSSIPAAAFGGGGRQQPPAQQRVTAPHLQP